MVPTPHAFSQAPNSVVGSSCPGAAWTGAQASSRVAAAKAIVFSIGLLSIGSRSKKEGGGPIPDPRPTLYSRRGGEPKFPAATPSLSDPVYGQGVPPWQPPTPSLKNSGFEYASASTPSSPRFH